MSTGESISISESQGETDQSSDKEKEIYFIIITPQDKNINFSNLKFKSSILPHKIYNKNIEKLNGEVLEHNVFKINIKKEEKDNNFSTDYLLPYIIGDDSYDIKFSVKSNSFVYETELLKGNKYIDNIIKENIEQNLIPLYNKLDIFLEAIENNKEKNKIEKLYEETIDLYGEKKKFSLLIELFLKIYGGKEQNKDNKHKHLCTKLIEKFKAINDEENTDRDKDLENRLDTFKQIYKNADIIINKNGYDKINFYGIIFCYLSSYDKDNFSKIIKDFSNGNANILYEILIIYNKHFKEPLNQEPDFYNNFLDYAINKGKNYENFDIILDYIEDIETFLFVINNNKNKIYKKYDDNIRKKPIILSSNLKLIKKEYKDDDKKEIDHIIKLIEDIILFSETNTILIIYLNSSFWVNILKQYNKADLENISNCHRLRSLYKKYNNLINLLYKNSKEKKELKIKNDINRYYNRD